MSTEFWLRFETQTPPTEFGINFLSVTATPERKVRLCLKLFDFFPTWILIRLTWNLSRFVPNSVETLTWNFRKKLFRRNFSEILLKTKAILYRNLWNFALLSAILFWIRIALKKFTEALSYVLCTQLRRHVHQQITNRRCKEKKPGRSVFGKQVLFTLGPELTTPYCLGILVWNFYQTLVSVSTEFWLRFETQTPPTGLAIKFWSVTARPERKVRLCLKLFDFFPTWIHIRLTWNLSRFVPNSVETLTWNFRKKLFRENFSEILLKTKAILYRNLWNFAILSAILFWIRIALKKFTEALSYVVSTQLRRHVHKQIKREYAGKKSQDVLFSENQFCSLSVRDLLRLTPWVFWSEIFTRHWSLCLLSFGWDLRPKILPQKLQ